MLVGFRIPDSHNLFSFRKMQQEIPDIPMDDAILAHVERIHGKHVFRIVILDQVIDAKFHLDGLFRGKKVTDLDIETFRLDVPPQRKP